MNKFFFLNSRNCFFNICKFFVLCRNSLGGCMNINVHVFYTCPKPWIDGVRFCCKATTKKKEKQLLMKQTLSNPQCESQKRHCTIQKKDKQQHLQCSLITTLDFLKEGMWLTQSFMWQYHKIFCIIWDAIQWHQQQQYE